MQISTGLPRPPLRTLEAPEVATQGEYRVLIAALANRGYGIAKTALPNHPPHVCVALLSRLLKSATWLLYSLLVAVQSATRSRSPRNAQHFTNYALSGFRRACAVWRKRVGEKYNNYAKQGGNKHAWHTRSLAVGRRRTHALTYTVFIDIKNVDNIHVYITRRMLSVVGERELRLHSESHVLRCKVNERH